MRKNEFYREQAEKFRDYTNKFPDRDLLSLFEEWADSKDFSEEDKKGIWEAVKWLYATDEKEKEARNRG